MEEKRLLGAIPSPEDDRDYSIARASIPTAFPREFTLKYLPKIKDQTVGSCVAHSVAYICEYFYKKIFGVGYIYGRRMPDYFIGTGMVPRDAAQTVTNYGNVTIDKFKTEKEMNEMKNIVDRDIKRLDSLAIPHKLKSYAKCWTVEDIKTALSNGNPVMFCTAISQWGTDKNGIFPCKSSIHGFHQMTIWGWKIINNKEYFYVANSWGTGFGKNGFCYMEAEDVFRCNDVITFVNEQKSPMKLNRTLKLTTPYMRGEDVKALEVRLSKEDGIKLNNDGIFNENTKKAIEIYQKRNGISVTGTVGTATWKKLGL